MVNFTFYTAEYLGNSIDENDFSRIAHRAQTQLEQYKRKYTVIGDETAENMAICAIADTIYYFEQAANGAITTGSSVGGVSTSVASSTLPDMSAKAQSAELYKCAKQYLDIYRGA